MMDLEKRRRFMEFFASLGEDYCCVYLSEYDWDRMESDKDYGLKAFLYGWAYERNGAARGWRIAAVKAIANKSEDMEKTFNHYYPASEGKNNNQKINPCMHKSVLGIDVPKICELIQKGYFESAFQHMKDVPGLRSHKLRAFFLRDLTVKIAKEPRNIEDLLFLQPVDVWVRKTADYLGLGRSPDRMPRGYGGKYCFQGNAYYRAKDLIEAAQDAGVSPLKVNQGIWYFCANFVANTERLATLLNAREGVKALEKEVKLLGEFNPKIMLSLQHGRLVKGARR